MQTYVLAIANRKFIPCLKTGYALYGCSFRKIIKWNLFLVEKIEFQNSRDSGDFPAILCRIHSLGDSFLEKEKNNNFSFLGENRRRILLKFINDKKVSIFERRLVSCTSSLPTRSQTNPSMRLLLTCAKG